VIQSRLIERRRINVDITFDKLRLARGETEQACGDDCAESEIRVCEAV
jgi:hypothetical protein